MLNRTRQAHNDLFLSLMTVVGWHKNCNLHHSFSVIPSWHCHCSWVFALSVLSLGWPVCASYCEHNLRCLIWNLPFSTSLNGFSTKPFDDHTSFWVREAQRPGKPSGSGNKRMAATTNATKNAKNEESSDCVLQIICNEVICQENWRIKSWKNSSCHWR